MTLQQARERILENPFYVLGLRPGCTRAQMEEEGQKLLGMLELGFKAAATYATPLGAVARTPEKVRAAMAELRDPNRRLRAELWAQLDPANTSTAKPAASAAAAADQAWPEALDALGWRKS
jgi:hypothetical protein